VCFSKRTEKAFAMNEKGLERLFSTTVVVVLTIVCAAAAILMAFKSGVKEWFG
jgi:uncharacterized membrane protein